MNKTISNVIMAFLMLFLRPVFAKTVLCQADNNKTYRIYLPNDASKQYREVTEWKRPKSTHTLVIKDVLSFDESEDYLKLSDGKYTITYALRCVNE